VIDPLAGEALKTGAVGAAPTISRGLDQLTLQRSLAGRTVKLVVTEAQGVTGEGTQVTLNQVQFLAIVTGPGERPDNP
jgi:type II secretory pathway component PulM